MKRIVIVCLAVIMLISALSCAPSSPTPSETPETTIPPAKEISIVLNAADKKYTIIRGENESAEVAEAASLLWKFFFETKAGEITSEDDWLPKGKEADNDNYEILVGVTNRPETAVSKAALKTYLDYNISVVDNKICIYANTPERISDAIEYFKTNITYENGLFTYTGLEYYTNTYDKYPFPNMSISNQKISEYVIVIPTNASEKEKQFAEKYAEYIALNSGVIINIVNDSTQVVKNEILIGNTNRPESNVDLSKGARIVVSNDKLVVKCKNNAYFDIIRSYLYDFHEELNGVVSADTNITPDNSAEEIFLTECYAAGLISENVNYGVLALLSSLEYFNDRMVSGSKNGERWVYSNKGANVKQTGYFDAMLLTNKKGANCASPVNWALTEMGIVPSNDRFYGGGVGEFKSYSGNARKYLAPYCEYFDFHSDPVPFHQLYKEGKVKAGDIFLCKHHTFVYRGDETFYAAGHDGAWHTENDAPTEDERKAVFDNWVLAFDEASGSGKKGSYNSNYNYDVHYIVRLKDSYIPQYFRNNEGQLISNPMYTGE